MRCARCGNKVLKGARYCHVCGVALGTGPGQTQSTQATEDAASEHAGDRRASRLCALCIIVPAAVGIAIGVLEAPRQTPSDSVTALVQSIQNGNMTGAIEHIDPADRPLSATAFVNTQFGGTLLSTIEIKGFAVRSETIDGNHALVSVSGQVCSFGIGCTTQGLGRLIASVVSDGTVSSYSEGRIPCEEVDGDWYVYAGKGSWATGAVYRRSPPAIYEAAAERHSGSGHSLLAS
jgi:hypothetical protein